MKTISIAIFLTAVVLAGCGKESEESLWKKVEASEATKNTDSTILVCQTMLKEYPTGKLAPGALYMIAGSYNAGKNDPRTATGYYRMFIEKYPDLKQTPVALFQIGFIYNNKIGNVDSARFAYEQFLAKYPQHELAPYAKFELDNLGKSPDTILAEQSPAPKKKK